MTSSFPWSPFGLVFVGLAACTQTVVPATSVGDPAEPADPSSPSATSPSPSTPGADDPASSTPSSAFGTFVYTLGGDVIRYDVATKKQTSLELRWRSEEQLGFGNGVFTNVVEVDDEYAVDLLASGAGGWTVAKKVAIPPLVGTGFPNGPVQPSPDGKLFAGTTRESAGLGEPYIDYVVVFDAASTLKSRISQHRDAVWASSTKLILARDDGLSFFDVATKQGGRVGTWTLGDATDHPRNVALSPNGAAVAFVQGDSVWVAPPDGSKGPARVTSTSSGQAWPTWSPDGTRLAVISRTCAGTNGSTVPPPEVAVVSATGTNQDVRSAATIPSATNNAPLRTCGPIYWLP